jgi:hypothetical protein
MSRIFIAFFLFMIVGQAASAQELQARVTVNADRVGTKVDRRIFQTLQTGLVTFLNNRKWTNETYQQNEKIVCNFLLNISASKDNNVYTASLTIQAARPIYNTSYDSPLINFIDDNVTFRYVEFQNLEFNENRVAGSDPYISNLTAVFAYYVYLILGLDGDSFAPRGGDPYFVKVQNIVNNAPDGRDLSGWKAFDGQRNRYWLMDNLTNARFTLTHDVIYNYYRAGMDNMFDNETQARAGVLNALNLLNTINADLPNTMFVPFFFQGKSFELIKMFRNASPDEKSRAVDLLSKLDITNANTYKQELK